VEDLADRVVSRCSVGARVPLALACVLLLAAQAIEGADGGPPPWAGREEAIELVLLQGEITARERIGHGVNNPWKVTVEHQGQSLSAIWKPLPEAERNGYRESHRAEVAAYRLSRILALDLVPPTVQRWISGRGGSMQFWIDGYRLYRDVMGQARPPMRHWSEQTARMRFFDVLIDNPDRNARNFLVDDDWRLVLIDHSRALSLPALTERRPRRNAPPMPARFDRDLVAGARALDLETLELLLGDLYGKPELRTLLRQRDELVRAADIALEQFGDVAFFSREIVAATRAACGTDCQQ
jgi:hypothetical protein